jgi:hypothetical protein
MTLYAGLLAEVRPYNIHFDSFGADEAISRLLVAVDPTKTGTKIAMPQMSIC